MIDFRAFSSMTDLASVMAIASQDGADLILTLSSGNTLRLVGITSSQLAADDFLFAP